MHDILTTLATVDLRLAARNGEVISRAFKEASITCVNCAYPDNVEDFSFWLSAHTDDKLQLHKAKKRLESHYRTGCYGFNHARGRCKSCLRLQHYVYAGTIEAQSTRNTLKQMWPCKMCMTLYNPTARINHVLRNEPEMKGFLDVRFD